MGWHLILRSLLFVVAFIVAAISTTLWLLEFIIQPAQTESIKFMLIGAGLAANLLLGWLYHRFTQAHKPVLKLLAVAGFGVAISVLVMGAANTCYLVKLNNQYLAAWWGPNQKHDFSAWLDYAKPNFSHKTACLQKTKQSKAYRSSLETLRLTLEKNAAKPQDWQAQPLQFERFKTQDGNIYGDGRYGITGGCRTLYVQLYFVQNIPGIDLFIKARQNHREQRLIGDINQCCPGDMQCIQANKVRFRLELKQEKDTQRSAGQSGFWLLMLANKPWPEAFKTGKAEPLLTYHKRLEDYIFAQKGQGLEIDYQELIEDPN